MGWPPPPRPEDRRPRPDPKPIRRHKADIDEWKILRRLKLGPCRVCCCEPWYTELLRIEFHHLVGRDLGGDDVPDNLVPLCHKCHGLVEEREVNACHHLRRSLTLREYAYVVDKKGVEFLSRYYPRRSAEDEQSTRGTDLSAA